MQEAIKALKKEIANISDDLFRYENLTTEDEKNDKTIANTIASLKDKRRALEAQVAELENQAKFGMEHVDKPVSPDDKPVDLSSLLPPISGLVSPLANKIGGQDASKVIKMADDFLSEVDSHSTMDAIQQAIETYKQAELEKSDFKKEYADILNEKSEKDKAVRESQRTLYGLLAKYAQTDVSIVELEGDSEGLVDLDIRNANVLPTGTGFSIKYEFEANELDLLKWCLQWNPTLLQVDMKKAEAYVKQLRVWSLGKRTADWYLPLEMPPAEIVPKILPTVGDVFAEKEDSDDTEK